MKKQDMRDNSTFALCVIWPLALLGGWVFMHIADYVLGGIVSKSWSAIFAMLTFLPAGLIAGMAIALKVGSICNYFRGYDEAAAWAEEYAEDVASAAYCKRMKAQHQAAAEFNRREEAQRGINGEQS